MFKASLQSLPSCQSRSLTTFSPKSTDKIIQFIQKVQKYDQYLEDLYGDDQDFEDLYGDYQNFESLYGNNLSTKMSEFMDFLLEIDINVLYESLHRLCDRKHFRYFDRDSQSWKCNSEYLESNNKTISFITLMQLHHIYVFKTMGENYNIISFDSYLTDYHKRHQIKAYLDIYYQGLSPSKCLDTIHQVWKSYPKVEPLVVLTCCHTLNNNTDDIKTNMSALKDYLIAKDTKVLHDWMLMYCEWEHLFYPIKLIQLYHIFALKTTENGRTIPTYQGMKYSDLPHKEITAYLDIYYQELPPSNCFDLIHQIWKSYPEIELKIKVAYCDTLLMNKKYQTCIQLICSNIRSVDEETINKVDCQTRNGYCVVWWRLLYYFDISGNGKGIQLALKSLWNLQTSLLRQVKYEYGCCYCYMGRKRCNLNLYSQSQMDVRKELIHNTITTRVDNKKYSINLLRTFKKIQISKDSIQYGKDDGNNISKYLGDRHDKCLEETILLADDDDDDDTWFKQCVTFCGPTPAAHKTEWRFETLIEELVDEYGLSKSVISVLSLLSSVKMMQETKDCIVDLLVRTCEMKYKESKLVPAQLVLDVNMDETASECPLADQLTLQLAKVLDLEETFAEHKNKVIYKCYCLVRHTIKKGNAKDIDIQKYKNYFTFIRYMEKQEEMGQQTSFTQLLILLMMLLLAGSSSGGHHKSAALKKFLSLKYEYDDAILYLLWCSGDVEINPGPTFQKLEKLPNSQIERNWLFDICSVLVKLTLGISEDDLTCKSNIWSTTPTDFPGDFSNPRKKSAKDLNRFFYDLLHYCKNIKKKSIPDPYQKEIDLFGADKTLLLKTFITRQETSQITKAVTNLDLFKGEQELQQFMTDRKIGINFGPNAPSSSVGIVERSEITRDLAVTLCRICKGFKPTLKSDGIWKEPPQGWNPVHPYYSPHNAGKRTDKKSDRTLVNHLLKHIRANHLPLPYKYKAIVKAWEEENIDDLRKTYTIHVYTASIEHSLQYLKQEGLLKDNEDNLKQIGLILDPEWFNSDGNWLSSAKKRKIPTKTLTKETSGPDRGKNSIRHGSSSSSDRQGVSVCQKTVHINTPVTMTKCPDNQSDGTICQTVDSDALAGYTDSPIASGTSQRNQFVLPPDNTVSQTRKSFRKRKGPDGQEEKQKSVKKSKIQTENRRKQPTLLPPIPSNELHSDEADSEIDDVTSRIISLVEDLRKDYGPLQQTQKLTDSSAQTDNYKVSNTEGSALLLNQSTSTYTVKTNTVSTYLPTTNTAVLPPDPMGQTNNDDMIKELKQPLPELNAVSESLNMTTQEVFDTIDKLTLNVNSASSLSKLNTSEQQSYEDIMPNQSKISPRDQPCDNVTIQSKMSLTDHSSVNDSEMEIDLTIFDKCDVDNV